MPQSLPQSFYFDINVNLSLFLTEFVSLSDGTRIDDGSFNSSELLECLAPKIVEWYNSNFPELELSYDDDYYFGGEFHNSYISVECSKNTLNHIAGFIAYNEYDSFLRYCCNRFTWSETREMFQDISDGRIEEYLDNFVFEYYIKHANDFSEDIDFDIFENLAEYGSNFIYSHWEYENEDLYKLIFAIAKKIPTFRDDLGYNQIKGDITIFYSYNDNFYNDDSDGLLLAMYVDIDELYHDILKDLKSKSSSYDLPDYFEIRIENDECYELIDFIITEDILSEVN